MKTTIDPAGRLVLPKSVREALHIEGEAELEVRIVDDHVELEPLPLEVEISNKDGFYVAVPKEPKEERLTVEEVENVRQQIREKRESSQR